MPEANRYLFSQLILYLLWNLTPFGPYSEPNELSIIHMYSFQAYHVSVIKVDDSMLYGNCF